MHAADELGHESNDLNRLQQVILQALSMHDLLEPFLQEVLGALQACLVAEEIAVVNSNPPQWHVLMQAGRSAASIPLELAADTLDRNQSVPRSGWVGYPLNQEYALLVQGGRGSQVAESCVAALVPAIAVLLDLQHRRHRIKLLSTILDITQSWNQTQSMETLLQEMAEAAIELLSADRASIFLWDKANRTLIARPALGMEDHELRFADTTGIVGQVVHQGEPRRVGGGLNEDQIDRAVDKSTGYQTETILCVPLTTPRGHCLGAFEVLNKNLGNFTDEDQQALVELATHAAVALQNTQQFEQLLAKHQQLVDQAANAVQLIGDSPLIEGVRSTVSRIADTDLGILILGENGTGKEVVAHLIHYLSRRRDQPLIAVNCAALSETLLESELFGHEKGAFTDAHATRAGKFELASGGTLFLDEIGDLSIGGQAKLLRVIEEKTVVRVGGSETIHTEVRILTATNQDLAKMVREKRFREDLYFRLNVVSLVLPPLRDRGSDILLLGEYFLQKFCDNMGRRMPTLTKAANTRLLTHTWPGNVRELRNHMERMAYLTSGDQIDEGDFDFINPQGTGVSTLLPTEGTLAESTQQFQRQLIGQVIQAKQGNMSQTAKQLGLHRSNLYRKMNQLGMQEEE
jgi:transcriptional regulator with GAF, ATPase, and Fis domain